jgi:hypothetical protein
MNSAHEHADPLIGEVRQRRRELWEACGGTLDGLLKEIQKIQSEHPEKLIDPQRRRPGRPMHLPHAS